jgi:hypothetical protein
MDIATSNQGYSSNLWIVPGERNLTHTAGSFSKGIILNAKANLECLWGNFNENALTSWNGLVCISSTAPSSNIQVVKKLDPIYIVHNPTISVRDQLIYIRARLALKVSDLAKIFKVDRQAIYGWINESYQPEEDRTSKLENLFFVAKLSSQYLTSVPQNICHQRIGKLGTLFTLFVGNEIDVNSAREILKALPHIQQEQRRNKMRHSSVRDALRRHGLDDSTIQSGIDEIDLATGKIKD